MSINSINIYGINRYQRIDKVF